MFASLGGVAVTNQQYVEEFFKNSEEDNEKKKECDLCHRTYSKDNGYSNLMNHLKSQHPDYVRIYDIRHPPVVSTQKATIDNFFGASSKAKQLWYWIRKVVLIPEPFTFVENPIAREGSVYEGITVETLKKYMVILKNYIMFKKIKPEIQIAKGDKIRNFGIVYDGWTHDSEHYLAMFATYTDDNGVVKTPMLSCSVPEDMDEETLFDEDLDDSEKYCGFTAADMFDMMMLTLHDEYDFRLPNNEEITADNVSEFVAFFVCDNCSANRALSNKTEIPMVGCASHRLNLAVESWIGTKERKNRRGEVIGTLSQNRLVITKIDKLMGEFNTLKNAPVLRGKCMQMLDKDLKPTRMQDTRWSSKFKLVEKEAVIRPVYKSVETWPETVVRYMPTPAEEALLDQLLPAMCIFENIGKTIQGEGTGRQSLSDVRKMFDGLIEEFANYPVRGLRFDLQHLRESSFIVNNPHFETGIVKVQQGLGLSPQEEEAVRMFKKTAVGATVVVVQSHADKYKKQKTSDYISTDHVLCDSNICERSNSRARLYMHYLRAHMAPESLELLLFLFCNREYWNYSKVVDEAIHWDTERRRAKRAAEEAAAAAARAADDDSDEDA